MRRKILALGLLVGGGVMMATLRAPVLADLNKAAVPATVAGNETATSPAAVALLAESTATAPVGETPPLANAEVTTADLSAAGFTDPVALAPQGTRFLPPTYYFRVKEKATANQAEWGDAADLVAVLVKPLKAVDMSAVPVGRIDYFDLEGRYLARTFRNGRYMVVIGPDGEKVAELAKLLEKKKFSGPTP